MEEIVDRRELLECEPWKAAELGCNSICPCQWDASSLSCVKTCQYWILAVPIVMGVLTLIGLVLICCWCRARRKRKAEMRKEAEEMALAPPVFVAMADGSVYDMSGGMGHAAPFGQQPAYPATMDHPQDAPAPGSIYGTHQDLYSTQASMAAHGVYPEQPMFVRSPEEIYKTAGSIYASQQQAYPDAVLYSQADPHAAAMHLPYGAFTSPQYAYAAQQGAHYSEAEMAHMQMQAAAAHGSVMNTGVMQTSGTIHGHDIQGGMGNDAIMRTGASQGY